MRKETIITAVVFLVVGFLAGYIAHAQLNSERTQRAAIAGGQALQDERAAQAATTSAVPGGESPKLPEGHPPLEIAGQMRALEDQANQNPSDPRPRLELANLLYDHHLYGRAIEWYQKALELDPKNISARTDMGTAYFYTGRPQDALREYRRSLEVDPKHEATLMNMIIVSLEGTRDLDSAQAAWERLKKVNPNHPKLDFFRQQLGAARTSAGSAVARK